MNITKIDKESSILRIDLEFDTDELQELIYLNIGESMEILLPLKKIIKKNPLIKFIEIWYENTSIVDIAVIDGENMILFASIGYPLKININLIKNDNLKKSFITYLVNKDKEIFEENGEYYYIEMVKEILKTMSETKVQEEFNGYYPDVIYSKILG